jgi:hypothetical protein
MTQKDSFHVAEKDAALLRHRPRRNERCACGSGKKFKHCHGTTPNNINWRKPAYIDGGESPVRWVIVNRSGTSFFSTKDDKIMVFKSRADANAIAMLDFFADQEPGDINVGGVGPTKWQHLQDTLPYIEVENADQGFVFIQERIDFARDTYLDAAGADADIPPTETDSQEN